MRATVRSWLRLCGSRRAVTAVEYGMIAAMIAVAIIGAVRAIGVNIATNFTLIGTTVAGS